VSRWIRRAGLTLAILVVYVWFLAATEVSLPRFRFEEGGPVRVPTVQGAMRIELPPGTRPGRRWRARG